MNTEQILAVMRCAIEVYSPRPSRGCMAETPSQAERVCALEREVERMLRDSRTEQFGTKRGGFEPSAVPGLLKELKASLTS